MSRDVENISVKVMGGLEDPCKEVFGHFSAVQATLLNLSSFSFSERVTSTEIWKTIANSRISRSFKIRLYDTRELSVMYSITK